MTPAQPQLRSVSSSPAVGCGCGRPSCGQAGPWVVGAPAASSAGVLVSGSAWISRGLLVNSARTPSRRTGRSCSNRSSTCSAACSSATSSVVGELSAALRVEVKKGAYRTFTATRPAGRPSATTSPWTRRVRAMTASRTSCHRVRSCWKVVSRLCDRATHGSAETVLRPNPRPRQTSQGPVFGPNRAATAAGSAPARSRTVCSPSSASLRAVFVPTPHSAEVGRSYIIGCQFSAVSRKIPAGLANSVASLARRVLSPMPMEQCRFVPASTAAWMSRARASGSGV